MRHALKMAIVVSILSVFYLGFGAIMNNEITHIAGLVEMLEKHPLAVTRAILTANRDSIAISRNAKDMILVTDPEHRRARLTEIELYERDIRENMKLVLDRITGQEGKDLATSAIKLLSEQEALRVQLTDAIFNNNDKLAASLAKTEGTALMKKIEDNMEKIIHYAETQSMEYQVESMSDLRRSKVILFSAGLIIAILSLVFTLAVEVPLLSSLNLTRNQLKTATDSSSLATQFKTPSPTNLNETLNGYVAKLKNDVNDINTHYQILDKELTDLKLTEDNLPVTFDQIIAKLEPILDRLGAFSQQHQHNQHGFHTISNALAQIRGDFTVISQMMASEDLLIDQFLLDDISDKTRAKLQKLKGNNTSLEGSIKASDQAIKIITELFETLMTRFIELKAAAIANKDVFLEIKNLRKQFTVCEQKLAHLKEISNTLEETINKIKLT